MGDCLGNTGPLIDDDPKWDKSIFNQGNLPPNTIIIDDLDLGCGPFPTTEDPTPSLEGYWDRDDTNGYLYPKQLNDEVLINYTSPYYDEQFGVSGKIYTTGGYMLGTGNILIFPTAAAQMAININYRNSVYVESYLMRGGQANAWYLNTLNPTNSPSTPPYTFYGDTDTGMYRHEDDGLAFSGGGSNLLVLNANGSIQLPNLPATAADEDVPVLCRNAATGIIEQRVLAELHTHSNIDVLNALADDGGLLTYLGNLVFDSNDYYTTTEIDLIETDIYTAIDGKADINHNHNLADLTEHSYISLTEKPDLSDLHSHANKPTLDVIPDYTGADLQDVMVRYAAGIAWLPISGITSGHWLRDVVGDPFLHPRIAGDSLKIDDTIFVDKIEELTTDNGILLGDVLTVDQLNSRIGIGVPSPEHDLDVAGSGRFSDPTAGQSIIGYGIIINNNASALAIADFQVKATTYNAIYVDASENSMLLMSNALGKVGFFGETPTVQSAGWTVANHVLDKVLDANATTINEICDVLGELITELKLKGILGG
jgi:hypothetical protein